MPPRVVLTPISDAGGTAWRELAARSAEPNPFFEPDFVEPAAAHLGSDGVRLLVARDGDDWIGCLPVVRGRLGGLVSWRHPYGFLGTPLVDRERIDSAVRALLEHACRSRIRGMLMLHRVGEGPVLVAVRDSASVLDINVVFETAHERAALERRDQATYLEGMRPHHRRELQRTWRRIEEHVGGPLVAEDLAGSTEGVERFLSIESSGWKGEAGTALQSRDGHAAFFRDVCQRFAAAGRLRLLALEGGGHTVAMKCDLAAGDGIFCFKIGHDAELGRYSPGVQLERATIQLFHDDPAVRFMDSCADPGNAMINRLWPDRRTIVSLVLSRRGARSVVSRHGIRAVQALRTRERRTRSTPS